MSAGIYIHTPFCRSRCSYCDFATGMYESDAAQHYVRVVGAEISRWAEVQSPAPVDTIYFGGGTPSLLKFGQLESILSAVREKFVIAADPEITLEINPGDGGASAVERLAATRGWRRLGINRASFGAQTFDDRDLKMLGRTHDSRDIRETFQQLRNAGFDNINFDLIAGLPGQTLEGWRRNLDQALKVRPEHLSLYLLDMHEGTPLHDQINRGMRPKPDEDLAAEMYAVMIEEVCAAGYEHYEVSNFSQPGMAARHNFAYWQGVPYLGIGPGAHSYLPPRRLWNVRDWHEYATKLAAGQSPRADEETVGEESAALERAWLGLRTRHGLAMDQLSNGQHERIAQWQRGGLATVTDGVARLTPQGWLVLDRLATELV